MSHRGRARSNRLRAIAVLLLSCATTLAAPVADDAPVAGSDVRERLETIREDLVQMRFDEALTAIEAVLARPGLSETERGEALVLRAQAHAAFGDFDAVERDYAEILPLRPGYAPDPALTPAKAQQRFEKVRSRTVGRIELSIDPPVAKVLVDGREVVPDSAGTLWLLAGAHTLRAESPGNDPGEQEIEVAAGKSTPVSLALVPNARTVVLRTVPAGVQVKIDGKPVGETSRDPTRVGADSVAELVIEHLPLGEHEFELSKECYRTERMTDTLAVDLLDRTPKRYQAVRMASVRTPLVLRGGPPSAEVRIDGKAIGRLPAESFDACPGSREITVRFRDRVVWQERAELVESVEAVFDVAPRPNVALVGAREWPRELTVLGSGFNTIDRRDRPAKADLSDPASWARIGVPETTDLALGVVPGERPGAVDRWYLYSPILLSVTPLEGPPELERPRWARPSWGLSVVDSEVGGAARVVHVRPDGPAAGAGIVAGDRLVEVGGRPVSSARDVATTLDAARLDRPIRVRWQGIDGKSREAELAGRTSPLLVVTGRDRPARAMIRAAWAVVDALVVPGEAPSAMANLGILLAEFDHVDLAIDVWRRVDWGARAGVGEGTKQYYLGRLLERSGREQEAAEAYRRAAASASTAFTDDGPKVALAARDHLADLGLGVDPRSVLDRRPGDDLVSAR